jgi:hypothetical protein
MNIDFNIENIEIRIPKYIFIVPYRDRYPQLICYINQMSYILEDLENNYEIVICHQNDERIFNRGAMKNLGFIYIKEKYPKHYENMNFIFQDIDTMPSYKNMFDYETDYGKIKHYYGFKQTLGGLFSIKGFDYEFLNGFPNLWGWGYEDNCLYKRALNNNIKIDRTKFYEAYSKDIIQITYGTDKINDRYVNKNGKHKLINDNGKDGINTIRNISYKKNIILEIPKNKNIKLIDFKNWIVPEKDRNVELVLYTKEYVYGSKETPMQKIQKAKNEEQIKRKKELEKRAVKRNNVLLGGNLRDVKKFNMGFTYK